MRKLLALAAAASGLLLTVTVNAAEVAAPSATASPTEAPLPPATSGAAANIPPTGPPVVIEVGKGTLFRLPRPAATVFVANPDIADVQVKSPSLIYISANKTKPGETVIYAVDDKDVVLVNKIIRVEYDLSRLRQSYKQVMPGERISVSSVEGDVLLRGTVSTAGQAQKARALAGAIVGEAAEGAAGAGAAGGTGTTGGASTSGGTSAAGAGGSQIINQLAVATPNQVNLRVRIAEVKSTVLKELGIQLSKGTPGRFTFTTMPPLLDAAAGLPATASLVQRLSGTNSITVLLDALTQNGLATNLAEPNLTALSGQPASFLVGGEIFIPGSSVASSSTGPSSSTVASGTIPVTFGVRLDFTATIIDANHINLKLRPEVSDLDFTKTTTISGSTVPQKNQTVAETTVDLGSGETFALAGLLQRNTNDTVSLVPGLGDIPVIGALFRTSRFTRDETELVIVVTPYIVRPIETAAATPVDGFAAPHDSSRILAGDLYRQQLPAAPRGPLGAGAQGLIGPGGFRLD
jgi:pilus assembly protein CpaC